MALVSPTGKMSGSHQSSLSPTADRIRSFSSGSGRACPGAEGDGVAPAGDDTPGDGGTVPRSKPLPVHAAVSRASKVSATFRFIEPWDGIGPAGVPRLGRAFFTLPGRLGGLGARNQCGVHASEHDVGVDDALRDVLAGGQLVHDVEQHLLHDGPQAARAGAAQVALVGDGLERALVEVELDAVELEELLVLLEERVLRLGEDVDERLLVE